ncbi:phospholipid-transporting ATPase ABCA3-like isoform X3 [Penaeus japonicus]|nr:phospholipid-transporting ATPase ABCA3-like isoform X3 [Penaeus japonicus]
MTSGSSAGSKFWLLLWKNWLLQRRKKFQTVIEVVLPVVFCMLLVVIRDLAPSDNFPEPTFFKPFSIDELPVNLTPSVGPGLFDDIADSILGDISRRRRRDLRQSAGQTPPLLSRQANVLQRLKSHRIKMNLRKNISRRKRFIDLLGFGDLFGSSWWPLAYAPNNTAVNEIMLIVADRISVNVEGYGFATESDLVEHLTMVSKKQGKDQMDFSGIEDVLGGVVFTNNFPDSGALPDDIAYKIRLKGSLRSGKKRNPFAPPPQWFTEVSYPLFQVPGPRERKKNEGGRPGYYDEGFLTIQHAVDMAITEYISGKDPSVSISVEMQRMPYPKYIDDKYLVALQSWLPFVLLISYIYPAINIVKSVVYEKEKKLKESMKMMGLQNWLHWMAWFIKSFLFLSTTTLLITILLCTRWQGEGSLAVLNNSDPTLVFIFLLLYTICSISFCFFISTLFSKANSAATATGLLWFFTYFPYMILRPRYSSLTNGNKIVLCLLSNTALSLGCQMTSMFEGAGSGIHWNLLYSGVSPDDSFTLGHVFGMLIIDTTIFALLTWYIETVWPGQFGMPQPWYFPFMKSYWIGQPAEVKQVSQEDPLTDPSLFEEDPKGIKAGVKINNLTKIFPRGKKVAVNKMFMKMYSGQITVLLGHNGAGKTTTMSMLTGLFPPTSGTAEVGGYDIVTQIGEVRRSLGLCPQHDVLFDELTVAEHIVFFSRLKGMSSAKAKDEVSIMVEKLKLEDKMNAMAKTLSGGMKRKLSVGIALCAGSNVVILDEPTSGMDPGARRIIWDLLQQERSGRTILLTTHFMEEADLLGDRIAIMANGVVQCCGSSLFLKKKYGAGYRLIIVKNKECDVDAITNVLQSHIPDAELDQNVGAELSYVLPNADVANFEALFSHLENSREELRISSYGASQTTMDEVFLRVGESVNIEDVDNVPKSAFIKVKKNKASSFAQDQENGLLLQHNDNSVEQIDLDPMQSNEGKAVGVWFNAALQRIRLAVDHAREATTVNIQPPKNKQVPMQRNTGFVLIMQQFWAMLVKKMLYTFRNIILTVTQNVIPVAFLILALVVVQTLPGVNDAPPPYIFGLQNYDGIETMIQIQNPNNDTKSLQDSLSNHFKSPNYIEVVDSEENFTTVILEKAESDIPSFNLHSMVSMNIIGDEYGAHIITFFNSQPFHTPPLALNVMDLAISRAVTGKGNLTITTSNHPLPRTDLEKLTQDSRQNLGFQIGFNLAFGMSFLAASFVYFLIQERTTKAKHLQFVSGVNFVTYWAASAIWDFIVFLVPCCLALVCLLIFNREGLSEPEQLGRIMIIFVFYVWVSLPLMYLCSFTFSEASTGFTRMIIYNVITGMATLITVTILRIPDLELGHVADLLDWIFLLFPSYAMASGITDLYNNWRIIGICRKEIFDFLCEIKSFANPCCKQTRNCGSFGCVDWNDDPMGWEKLGIGRMLVFMGLEGLVFYIIIALIELKVFHKIRYSTSRLWGKVAVRPTEDVEKESDPLMQEDEDVANERMRIRNTPLSQLHETDKLIFSDLSKTYSGNFMAVNRLNLGVPLGECFGLLGINGAGKTTTFKMLTGDLQVSSGNAFVNGYSIKSDLKKVQQEVGYCPQFDAILDQMTGREALRMFARLRGVPEREINRTIVTLAEQLLVSPHLDNLVGNYSGGNKRKLSTGVALVGDPPLVLLDEPTSGMDPVARRVLWDVLTSVRDAGRSIILTSHSMEECEALCTRLAIMVNGKFCCLGSPQHLKSKFSEGYSIIIRVHISQSPDDNETTLAEIPPEMLSVKQFIETTYPANQLREMQWGRLEYFVPATGITWASVFGTLEKKRKELSIEDYSVTQTTLERVFLTFTRGQRPDSDTQG